MGSLAFMILAAVGLGGAAGAAPSATLVFSTDGGTTWSSAVNAAPGQTVLAREYFDNDTSGTMAGVSITTSIPGGFTRVPGSTKVCLNPGTTNPTSPTGELACNTDTDQGGPITEAAVWSGSNLAISPTAGLLAQSPSANSGTLQVGQPRYLHLDQCAYLGGTDTLTYLVGSTPNSPNFRAGSGSSNTSAASPTCGPGAGGYPFQSVNSGVEDVSLLGHRYLNLDQCAYYNGRDSVSYFVDGTANPGFSAGTASSNSTPASPTCGAGRAGYGTNAINSGVANIDLLGSTTLNLEQCEYLSADDSITYGLPSTPNANFGASTGASSANVGGQRCQTGSVGYPYQPANSGYSNISLVDPSRGQGFVQFAVIAPSPPTTTTYTETGQVNGPGTGNPMTSSSITVDASFGAPIGSLSVAGGVGAAGLLAVTLNVARRRRPRSRSRSAR